MTKDGQTCANGHVNTGIRNNRQESRYTKWMAERTTMKVSVSSVIGVHSHSNVSQHRLKTCCSYHNLTI